MSAIVHVGNVLDILPTLEAGSVNCCVCSPPYWGLRDYGTAQWEGGDAGCDHIEVQPQNREGRETPGGRGGTFPTSERAFKSVCAKCGARRIDSQLGLEPTPELYVANMVAVFREVKRVLRDDGTLWLNLGDSYNSSPSNQNGHASDSLHGGCVDPWRSIGRHFRDAPGLKPKDLCGIPWRVAFALQADGWYLRSDIIWSKLNPMPESVTDRPTKAHEYVFLLTKAARYFYDADAIGEPVFATNRHDATGPGYFAPGQTPQTGSRKTKIPGGWDTAPGAHATIHRDGRTEATYQEAALRTTRNRRTVWTIATQPFKEAHFATMPEKLVEPCVLAGCPAQVCSECGAPWERVVESAGRNGERRLNPGDAAIGHCSAKSGMHHPGWRKEPPQAPKSTRQSACTCNAETVPGTVLDPFAGSGTTGAVACRLGRNFVGIELNESYVRMAERRIYEATKQTTLWPRGSSPGPAPVPLESGGRRDG